MRWAAYVLMVSIPATAWAEVVAFQRVPLSRILVRVPAGCELRASADSRSLATLDVREEPPVLTASEEPAMSGQTDQSYRFIGRRVLAGPLASRVAGFPAQLYQLEDTFGSRRHWLVLAQTGTSQLVIDAHYPTRDEARWGAALRDAATSARYSPALAVDPFELAPFRFDPLPGYAVLGVPNEFSVGFAKFVPGSIREVRVKVLPVNTARRVTPSSDAYLTLRLGDRFLEMRGTASPSDRDEFLAEFRAMARTLRVVPGR